MGIQHVICAVLGLKPPATAILVTPARVCLQVGLHCKRVVHPQCVRLGKQSIPFPVVIPGNSVLVACVCEHLLQVVIMDVCILAYVHAYIHTYIHRYIHKYIHTYTHTYTPTCFYTYTCTLAHAAAIEASFASVLTTSWSTRTCWLHSLYPTRDNDKQKHPIHSVDVEDKRSSR